MKEWQYRQPPVVIVNLQVEGRANGAPPVIAIGKHRTLRPARGAGRENDGMYRRQVNVVDAGGFIGAALLTSSALKALGAELLDLREVADRPRPQFRDVATKTIGD